MATSNEITVFNTTNVNELPNAWYQTGLVKISAKLASFGVKGTTSNLPTMSWLVLNAMPTSQYRGSSRYTQ